MITHTYEDKYSRSRGAPYIPVKHPNQRVNEKVYERFVAHNTDISQNLREGYKTFIDLIPVSRFRPVTPVGQLLWDEHVRAFNLAVRHKYTPAEALERGRATVQKQLDLILRKTVYPPMKWRYPMGFLLVVLLGAVIAFVCAMRDRSLRRRVLRRETAAGIAFASPWLLGLVMFTAGPIFVSIIFSFCQYDVVHPAQFVGLENYRFLLREDPLFWKSLWNTVFLVLGVPLGMIVSLAVAMLLNANVRGMAAYRTIFYLPAIVPVVASSILWIWVLNPIDGLLNTVIQLFLHGLSSVLTAVTGWAGPDWLIHWTGPRWLQSEACAKPAIIVMNLWGAGASMIIWLAGLKGIPKHLYEAAEIDGAGHWSQFWHITLPMLSPYIFFNLTMGIIHTFQIFAQAFVMTQGGPADATLFYVYHLFNNAFRFFKMGYASAMAWILFVIVLVLTLIQIKLAPKWVHYETT
jgi:multiple sugar transport system permease protein